MKGNLFLGFGRKSVGDVVFYKRKGSNEQMARARNRNPHNPKTDKQLYQRAIMATVLQAYSTGKDIFDHSFEGKSVPDGSMNRFMSLNLRRLRAAIAEDLAGTSNPAMGRVVVPGAPTPVPFAYRISEGSYDNSLLTYVDTAGDKGFKFPTPDAADTTPALYLSNHGFTPGDLYTIVAFGIDHDTVIASVPDGTGDSTDMYGCYFGWVRLQVRSDAPSTGALTFSNLFTVTSSHGVDGSEFQVGISFGLDEVFGNNEITDGSIGAIRSRYDSGVRSTSDMHMITGALNFGITSEDILLAWRAGTQQVGDPSLILEGGGSSQPRPAVVPIAASGDMQVFADPECSKYATGSESKVYLRFNNVVGPTTLPAQTEFLGAYNGNLENADAQLWGNGSAFFVLLWESKWQTLPFTQITEGLVVEAVNPAVTPYASASTIFTWVGGD